MSLNYYNDPVLPWTSTRNDERFLRITKWVLIIFITIGIIIPWLPSPEAEKKPLKQVAPRLAKLITQKRLQKIPPPPVKTVEKKVVKKKIEPKVETKKIKKAQEKAKQSGLMAMSKDIQDLQSMFDVSTLDSVKPIHNNSAVSKATKQSSVISSNAAKSSGGIDTSKLSRSTSKTALAGRQSSNVSSNIDDLKSSNQRQTRSGQNTRPEQELQLVFDRYKGALESIYMRTLRKDPTLQGKVVFELTISPSGKVTKCRIISSELHSKDLENRLISRIKSFQFSNQNVETVTVTYPIDFLPS
jgi:TonB family protein